MMLKALSRAKWFAVALVATAVPVGLAYAQTPVPTVTATFTAPPPKPNVTVLPTTLWSLPLDINNSAPVYSLSGTAQVQAFLRLINITVSENQHVEVDQNAYVHVFSSILKAQPAGKYAITINARVGGSPTKLTVSKTVGHMNPMPGTTVGTCTLTAGKSDFSEWRSCTVTGLPLDNLGGPEVAIRVSGMVYLGNFVLSYQRL